jgi:hypothetical protein
MAHGVRLWHVCDSWSDEANGQLSGVDLTRTRSAERMVLTSTDHWAVLEG